MENKEIRKQNIKIDEKVFANELGDSMNSKKLQHFSISNFINSYENPENLRLKKIICNKNKNKNKKI